MVTYEKNAEYCLKNETITYQIKNNTLLIIKLD